MTIITITIIIFYDLERVWEVRHIQYSDPFSGGWGEVEGVVVFNTGLLLEETN